jgi:23S rRNA (pseudouridine1915-N3)-methyltransferase
MRIRIIFLGKTKRAEIRSLVEDYLARIHRFAQVDVVELRDSSAAAARKLEFAPGATVVLLEAGGKPLSSESFAKWLGELRDRGARELIFLCGDADGFPEEIRRRATVKLSLSPLTFSHELARAMLAEQLYRAFTILAGHPYAK